MIEKKQDSNQQQEYDNLLEEDNKNQDMIDNPYLESNENGDISQLLEGSEEPELWNLIKDSTAIEILKNCSGFAKEEKWDSLMKYLEIQKDNLKENSLDQKPNDRTFIILFYLGVCNFRKENYQESLKNFLECRKIYQNYQIDYNIALCDIKTGQLDNAIFYLESVNKQNKTFFFAYYNLIKIFLKKNNTNDAFLIYRDFSEIIKKEKDEKNTIDNDDKYRPTVNNYNIFKLFYKIGAECLFAKQLYQECVYTILDALKFNPNDPELWLLYGKVFIMKKNFEFSIPLIKKALEIDPDYQEAKRLLEYLYKNKD